MATTTLAVARQALSEEIGDWRQETTTSAGAGGGTTLVSTALADKGDDYYNDGNWWVILTSGTYSGEYRRVSDFVSSTGTVTVSVAFTGQVATSVTFEMHHFRPVDITRALNAAALEAYPWVSRRIIDDSLISGNWLHDSGFEDWSSATALNNWVAVSASFSKLTTVYSGRLYGAVAPIVTPSGANGGIQQLTTQNPRLQDLRGESVDFRAMVVTAAAADIVLRITDVDGTTTSTALDTNVIWKRLTATRTISETTKTLTFEAISPAPVANFRIDNARVIGPPIYEYRLPAHLRNLTQVEIQQSGNYETYPCDDLVIGQTRPLFDWRVQDDGTNRTLIIPYFLPSEYKIRLTGEGLLSTLSADTDTWEIGNTEPPFRALIAFAAHKLFAAQAGFLSGQDRNDHLERASYFGQQWEKLKREHCFPLPSVLPVTKRWRYNANGW